MPGNGRHRHDAQGNRARGRPRTRPERDERPGARTAPAALYGLSGKGDAWIIDSNAGPERLAEWRRSGATVVTLDVAYDVCLARAKAERPGTTAVVEWFARHGGRQW